MLQSFSDPVFAGPFLGTLTAGGLGVAIGVGYAWLMDRRADSRLEWLSARLGGVGLAGMGVAIGAAGFSYAGTVARLGRLSDIEPSLVGRIGLALPWEAIAGTVSAAALGCVLVSVGLSLYVAWSPSDTAN